MTLTERIKILESKIESLEKKIDSHNKLNTSCIIE